MCGKGCLCVYKKFRGTGAQGPVVSPGQLKDGKQYGQYFPSCPLEWFEYLQ